MEKDEFKIICINDTVGIGNPPIGDTIFKFSVFDINIYEYNYGVHDPFRCIYGDEEYLRITYRTCSIIGNSIAGLYKKSDFMRLSDYIMENRNKIIDQILVK